MNYHKSNMALRRSSSGDLRLSSKNPTVSKTSKRPESGKSLRSNKSTTSRVNKLCLTRPPSYQFLIQLRNCRQELQKFVFITILQDQLVLELQLFLSRLFKSRNFLLKDEFEVIMPNQMFDSRSNTLPGNQSLNLFQ